MSKSADQNPYVGPRSLKYGEAIYGRDREARQLLDLLIAERIVLLYSPSGAGKTSLIQAGLIPELEKEEFHVLPVIRVSRGAGEGVYPCNPYVFSALLSLEQGVPPEKAIPAEELASMPFGEYLERREATSGTDDGTFLIFDQFEEILSVDPMNREAKMDFFNQVGEALRDLKRWALFAMREDHVAALDPYLRPIPTRLKSTFRLDLLNAENARVAVQRPAKECGVEFTEEATTKLVDDLRQVAVQGPTGAPEIQLGPYIEPVQLQVVCYRLWEKLPEHVEKITEEQVVGTGDVDSALADYFAERVAQIARKCSVKERVVREWFDRRLITESGIRSQVMVGSENSREISEAAIQELVNVHLIRGEERRGVTWLELAHDRLVKPIRANNSAWWEKNLSVLQHQAAVWNNRGRSDALCLRGDARKEATKWADEHEDELTQTEREFLDVCQRNHDARTNRWVGWVAIGLSILVAGVSWLAFYALRQARVATARSIAAQALQFRDERLDTALLLATESQRLGDLPETRGSLLTASYYNPRLSTYLNGSPAPVGAVAYNHDGTKVATGGYDGRVVVWDAKTHQPIEQYLGVTKDAVRTIAFSLDGRFMAVSSKDKQVVLRDLRSKEMNVLPPAQAHGGDVWVMAFSADSTLLASGDSEGKIVVWNLATRTAKALASVGSTVRGVAFDPHATTLAAGCGNGSILVWSKRGEDWLPVPKTFSPAHPNDPFPDPDPQRRKTRIEADASGKGIRALVMSSDGSHLAVGRESGAVDLYDLSMEGEMIEVAAFGRHDDKVSGLAFSSDTTRLISSSFDGTLRLWEMPTMIQRGPPFTGHVGRVFSVAFSADKKMVVSGGMDRRAILWDTWENVAQVRRAEVTDAKFTIAYSPDGAYEAGTYSDGHVIVIKRDVTRWEETARHELAPPDGGPGRGPIATFSGNSRVLAVTTRDGKVRVFDLQKWSGGGVPAQIGESGPFTAAGDLISALALSRDGALAAVGIRKAGGAPAQMIAWNLATGARFFKEPLIIPNEDLLNAIEFSPDGSRLAIGGLDERPSIWLLSDSAGQHPIKCDDSHTGSIRTIAFSPDGELFATGSGDTTLMIWDTVTGKRFAPPLTGHRAPIITAAFSPDGKTIATGSDDHSVILWDVKAKQSIGRLTGHTDSVRALAFSGDSARLYSGSWDVGAQATDLEGSRSWELDPKVLQVICRTRANRNLSKDEWSAYIPTGKMRETWPALPRPGEELSSIPTSKN